MQVRFYCLWLRDCNVDSFHCFLYVDEVYCVGYTLIDDDYAANLIVAAVVTVIFNLWALIDGLSFESDRFKTLKICACTVSSFYRRGSVCPNKYYVTIQSHPSTGESAA